MDDDDEVFRCDANENESNNNLFVDERRKKYVIGRINLGNPPTTNSLFTTSASTNHNFILHNLKFKSHHAIC